MPAEKGVTRAVTAAQLQEEPRFDVLVFSRTTGFRHSEAIDAGKAALTAMGTAQNFTVTLTEDATQFTDAILRPYEVIVMLHPDGEGILTAAQRTAFERWLQRGKGLVGIHAAANADRNWDWMTDLRGGSLFLNHPSGALQFQQATVKNVDSAPPGDAGHPGRLGAHGRVVQLHRRAAERPRARQARREHVRGGGRQRGGRRPSDRVVLELRPRPHVLHGARPSRHRVV